MSFAGYDLPDSLKVEADGAVRYVTFNRPDEMNAMDVGLHRAVADVWRQLSADREARVVVLTGAGKAFSAGGDFGWMTTMFEDPAARYDSLREGAQIIEEMLRFPLPVIAAVNGAAMGLGCSMAVLSDVSLISTKAYLCDPHVSIGLVAGDGGAAFWPLLTPIMRSREYLLTGDRITPEVAVELGLATRVVEADQLMDETRTLAEKIARQPYEALRGTKRIINMYMSQALAGPMWAGFAAEEVSMQTTDHRERVEALRAKMSRS